MALKLPQPASTGPYSYVLYEDVEKDYFRSILERGTLCWVLKSKGVQSESLETQRVELFMRARVVADAEATTDPSTERRVLVRYPRGTMYQVKRANLIPVLEPQVVLGRIVLVVPETPEYRRACVVHTCVGDSFLEIGCDFGPTVDRVRKALLEGGAVPRWPGDNVQVEQQEGRVTCLGIDKSQESIDIAVSRFPECTFSVEDALTEDGVVRLRDLCKRKLAKGYPSVVAVDINGNREIPAVLDCLGNVLNPIEDKDDWKIPRLVIVKSRLLHAEIKKQRQSFPTLGRDGTTHVPYMSGDPRM